MTNVREDLKELLALAAASSETENADYAILMLTSVLVFVVEHAGFVNVAEKDEVELHNLMVVARDTLLKKGGE